MAAIFFYIFKIIYKKLEIYNHHVNRDSPSKTSYHASVVAVK